MDFRISSASRVQQTLYTFCLLSQAIFHTPALFMSVSEMCWFNYYLRYGKTFVRLQIFFNSFTVHYTADSRTRVLYRIIVTNNSTHIFLFNIFSISAWLYFHVSNYTISPPKLLHTFLIIRNYIMYTHCITYISQL